MPRIFFATFGRNAGNPRSFAVLGLCAALVAPVAVGAETLSTKSRRDLFQRQTSLLDSRASKQYANSVRLQPRKVIIPGTPDAATPSYRGKYRGPYLSLAQAAARKHGVPEELFARLVQQESGWNPNARSHKGAMGLAQLMPQTARVLRVDPNDPKQNLEGGARYLRQQYNAFGSWRLALAAYNAGPAAVTKYGGIPPYKETRNYVRVILGS